MNSKELVTTVKYDGTEKVNQYRSYQPVSMIDGYVVSQ